MNSIMRGIMNTRDARRVDLDRSFEVEYWAVVLGISEPHLTALVSKVGNAVQDIRRELAKAAVTRRVQDQRRGERASDSELFTQKSEECHRQAQRAVRRDEKALWLDLAHEWQMLADPDSDHPPAGPHAKPELTDYDKTPGAGTLPSPDDPTVDTGTG